jgi:O-antigen ligase
LVCASIIAVYGIWQHYTGIDLWRHSHRALVVIPWGKGDVYSTVGLFNHHLTYAYSYGMILCIAWAMLLLMNIPKFPKMIVSIGFALILGSIICTYGRGAWIALGITLPFMTLLTSRKNFVIMLTLFCVGLGVLYKVNGTFRERLQSIDSANYKSNEERRKLWEINFEMFKDHPLVGVGYLENEDLSFPYYERMHISDGMAGHAHSNYFEFLATAGLPGFIAYLVMIILPLILSVKLFLNMRGISGTEALWDRCMILAAVGAQLVFHIGGFTQCTVCDSKVLHQFIFWLALVYFFRDKYKDRDLSLRSHPLAQTQPNLS